MPAYDDEGFAPAAPVATVILQHPESGESLAGVPMLLDSGADATLLPESATERWALSVQGSGMSWWRSTARPTSRRLFRRSSSS